MSYASSSVRRKGVLTAALLFALGIVTGVAGDRAWTASSPERAEAAPLTPEGMAEALGLDDAEASRVRFVLDSLRPEVGRAVQAGSDSLASVARRARQRLEEALPSDRRGPFQDWMQEHHARMMEEMGGSMMGGGMMGGGMGPMTRGGG